MIITLKTKDINHVMDLNGKDQFEIEVEDIQIEIEIHNDECHKSFLISEINDMGILLKRNNHNQCRNKDINLIFPNNNEVEIY